MRLIWTAEEPASDTWSTLKARGYSLADFGIPERSDCRITGRFPVLLSEDGGFVGEAFSFLFEVAFVRGSTRSTRTLETYAESLVSWLSYAEAKGIQWTRPTPLMLAGYRDHLLAPGEVNRASGRPLSRRTANLRLSVAIEFYRHLGQFTEAERVRQAPFSHWHRAPKGVANPRSRSQGWDFRRLRVRVYSRRPKALAPPDCRALCYELRNPYRLVWQWALCTGLRISSLVRIRLEAFRALGRHSSRDRTIDVPAKGGKIVSVHVPDDLLQATARYVAVERVMAAARRPKAETLFLNGYGRAVTYKAFYRALKRAGRKLKISASSASGAHNLRYLRSGPAGGPEREGSEDRPCEGCSRTSGTRACTDDGAVPGVHRHSFAGYPADTRRTRWSRRRGWARMTADGSSAVFWMKIEIAKTATTSAPSDCHPGFPRPSGLHSSP